eukprot:tig00020616_g12255.t1
MKRQREQSSAVAEQSGEIYYLVPSRREANAAEAPTAAAADDHDTSVRVGIEAVCFELCGFLKDALAADNIHKPRDDQPPLPVDRRFASREAVLRISGLCSLIAGGGAEAELSARLGALSDDELWETVMAAEYLQCAPVSERLRALARARVWRGAGDDVRALAAAGVAAPASGAARGELFGRLADFVQALAGLIPAGLRPEDVCALQPSLAYHWAYELCAAPGSEGGENSEKAYDLAVAGFRVAARAYEAYPEAARRIIAERSATLPTSLLEDVLGVPCRGGPLEEAAGALAAVRAPYAAFTGVLLRVFRYLDLFHAPREGLPSLADAAKRVFREAPFDAAAPSMSAGLAEALVAEARGGAARPAAAGAVLRVLGQAGASEEFAGRYHGALLRALAGALRARRPPPAAGLVRAARAYALEGYRYSFSAAVAVRRPAACPPRAAPEGRRGAGAGGAVARGTPDEALEALLAAPGPDPAQAPRDPAEEQAEAAAAAHVDAAPALAQGVDAAAAAVAGPSEALVSVRLPPHTFRLQRAAAELSGFLKREMEAPDYAGDGEGVRLPAGCIPAPTMRKLVAFCRYRALKAGREEPEAVRAWESRFIAGDNESIFALIMAANRLEVQPLLDLGCMAIADKIRGKSPEEIRQTFNIRNDFTPEEEEEIRRENAWTEEAGGVAGAAAEAAGEGAEEGEEGEGEDEQEEEEEEGAGAPAGPQ